MSAWGNIGLVLFLRMYGPRLRLGQRELDQYSPIRNSRSVNKIYAFCSCNASYELCFIRKYQS